MQPQQPFPGQPPANNQAQQPAAPQQPRPASTQNSLLFSEIRENMVIMADGSFRAIVACKSINFDLMSSREREGVEFSYQNFLNALYFPVQILCGSVNNYTILDPNLLNHKSPLRLLCSVITPHSYLVHTLP
jgi:hypothetical protein